MASQAETVLHSFYPNSIHKSAIKSTSSLRANLSASTPSPASSNLSYDERHSVLGVNSPAFSWVSSLVALITSLAPGFEQGLSQFVMKESPAAHHDLIWRSNLQTQWQGGDAVDRKDSTNGGIWWPPSCRASLCTKMKTEKLAHAQRHKITAVAPNSSASKNGLTLNQAIVEIDGISVVAYCSKEVSHKLENAPRTGSLTVMPWEKYQQLIYK
ncbi:unnamed protein product, partial [Mesorhabditis belari]|uniref:Uncharacterized protein n=1 Tax=Mesorhabditis belari TaxID=2138241 RepID=A0AAF3FQK2_9BILA